MARYFLRTGLLEFLTEDGDTRVILLCPKEDEDRYRKEFEKGHTKVIGVSRIPSSRFYEILLISSQVLFGTRFNDFMPMFEWHRGNLTFPRALGRRAINIISKRFPRPIKKIIQKTVRTFVMRRAVSKEVFELFAKYRPDLLFATSLIAHHFDIPIAVEARRQGIKVAGSVRGWDNLCNYGFILFHPDWFLVQNEYLRDAAIAYNFFPEERIKIIGFPHFDWYARKDLIMPREQFLARLGVEPQKRIILFAGTWGYEPDNEPGFADVFERLALEKKIPSGTTLLFRAHPLFVKRSEKELSRLTALKTVVLDKIRGHEFNTIGNPEIDNYDMIHLLNVLYHSDIIITPHGTIAVEATTFDKPIITIAHPFAAKNSPPYWFTFERLYDTIEFWMDFLKCGGTQTVRTIEEFTAAINAYLQDPRKDSIKRNCIRDKFLGPFDGKITRRLAEELLKLVLKDKQILANRSEKGDSIHRNMRMRTIFITIAEDMIARNIFYTDFWPAFLKKIEPDTRLVLLVQADRLDYFKNIFKGPNIHIISYKRVLPSRLENMIMSIARSSINNHTNLWSKMHSYTRGDSGFTQTYSKRILTFLLGDSVFYKRCLRSLILRFPADEKLQAIFDEWQPDLLFTTSIANYDFDVLFAREAKRRGIRNIGMVRSWDNLSSHGLLRVVPNVFIFQNEFLKEMAIRYQAISSKDTETYVIGLPHYDFYFQKEKNIQTREEFFMRNRLDPKKKVVLYCGMGEFLFRREGDLIDILDEMIERGEIKEPVQVLYSGHPKFRTSWEKAQNKKHVIPSVEVTYVKKEGGETLESETSHTKDLMNLIYHSDVLVMGASSMAIDAAALYRPIVCIGFDGSAKRGEVPYWLSVERFYDTYTHFEDLMQCGGVQLARSQKELASFINQYLSDPQLDADGRKKIIKRFATPFDGKSGERLAECITTEVTKITER